MIKSFLGANTTKGFVSMFEEVSNNKGCMLYILKGGSGTGKSTFIKDIVKVCIDRNIKYEQYHCSSDINSLDGIYIKELNFAMIDGTSPHIVDPKAYGVSDCIINLGEYINKDVAKFSDELKIYRGKKAELYATAYKFIEAGGVLFDRLKEIYKNEVDTLHLYDIAKKIINSLDLSMQKSGFQSRNMMLSALTSSGFVSFAKDLNAKNIISLTNSFDNLNSVILEQIILKLKALGYTFINFKNPIDVNLTSAIYIENTDTLILGRSIIDDYEIFGEEYKVHNNALSMPNTLNLFNQSRRLLESGCGYMTQASKFHNQLEEIYYPYIDFSALTEMKKAFIYKLFN